MTAFLNASSQLQCPHGGMVQIVTANTKVKAGGDFVVVQNDTFTISGCPLVVASSPHPCVRIEWQVATTRNQVGGAAVLNEQSVGMCLAADNAPQGTALVVSTQKKVKGL